MKYLIIVVLLSCGVLFNSALSFAHQLNDVTTANLCIKEKISAGVERSAIGVHGSKCFIK